MTWPRGLPDGFAVGPDRSRVTRAGTQSWGMRLLTHRRRVLLLVVGLLAGVALICAGLELLGVPVLEPFGVDELFTRHEPTLPSGIDVEGSGAHADPDSTLAPVSVPAPTESGVARPATPHPR